MNTLAVDIDRECVACSALTSSMVNDTPLCADCDTAENRIVIDIFTEGVALTMNRTIIAGKYAITASYDPANEYADNLTIIERDAFRGGRLVGTDTSSRYETSIDAEWIETVSTRELIELALFGQWTFGYPYVGIGGGEMLCMDCAINALVDLADAPDDDYSYLDQYDRDAFITVTVLQELPPAGEY